MKKTKKDIQLELLKEIDAICSENNLKYILFGDNALNAYNNHTIKDAARIVAVAMTQGDVERFCDIVEENYSQDRFVEGLFNNPRCNSLYVSYGNKNTTDISIVRGNYNNCRGIRIRIYYIKKRIMNDGTYVREWTKSLSKEKAMRKYLNTKIVSPDLWFAKAGLGMANGLYNLTGGGKRYYKQLRSRTYIDKWEDIQECEEVGIGQSGSVPSKCITGIKKYEVDGMQLCMPEDADTFFANFYGDAFNEVQLRNKNQRSKTIISTEVGYEDMLRDHEQLFFEARKCQEEILWERLKCKNERETVLQVWRLVKMTQKQVEFIHYFEENIDRLLELDFDDEEQYEQIYSEVRPVISALWKYSKYGMTFSVDEKTDALVERVLEKRNSFRTINRIKTIKEKQYYVE